MILNNGDKTPNPHALELISYRVLGKRYSQWLAIMAEATGGQGDSLFKQGLFEGHNIRVEATEDPMLYITQDTGQMRELLQEGVVNPTMLQLLLSTKCISLSAQGAMDDMTRLMEGLRVKPEN